MGWLFVPVPEGSSLGSVSRSGPATAVWVTLNGKPTQRRLSWRGWRTRRWIGLLSGTISQPSGAQSSVDAWISSLPARHVSPSARPAPSSGKTTSAGSGPMLLESLAKWDRASSCWKTCRAYSLFGEEDASAMYSESWPTSGSMRSGTISQRPESERLTAVVGSSFSRGEYPTPASHDYGTSQNEGQVPHQRPTAGTPSLSNWARNLWTTPGAHDYKGSTRPGQRQGQLDEQVSHRFHLGQMTSSSGNASSRPGRTSLPPWVKCSVCQDFQCTIHGMHAYDCPCPPIEEWETDPYSAQPAIVLLNPYFVEWLMAWPIGWSASEPLETGLFPLWLLEQSLLLHTALES